MLGRPVNVRLNSGTDYRGKPKIILSPGRLIQRLPASVIFPIADHFFYFYWYKLNLRCARMFRWVHEYCNGADRRICGWTIKIKVWGLLHSWEQWCVLFDAQLEMAQNSFCFLTLPVICWYLLLSVLTLVSFFIHCC